VVTHKYAARKP